MQDPAAPASTFDALRNMPWIDQVGLALVSVFLILGWWRGLWWQVMRLLSVMVGIGVARSFAPDFAPHLNEAFKISESAAFGLCWFGLFLGTLIICSVIALTGKRVLEALQLNLVDRFGGALAGGLTALIIHAAFLILITGLGETSWSQRTLRDARSKRLLDAVSNQWPILVDAKARERFVDPLVVPLELQRRDAPSSEGDLGTPTDPGARDSNGRTKAQRERYEVR